MNNLGKEEKINNINKKIIIVDAIIVVLVVLLVASAIGFLKQKLVATASTVVYTDLKDEAVSEDHAEINFSVVKSAGSTATSWIYVPGTTIDYPLVQGPNNDYYINYDAFGNESTAGAIFINFANSSDMSDAKTIIFGHNMSDGSMFTDLHKYADESYGQVHQDAYIYMESGEVKHYKLRYYLFTQPLDPVIYVVSKADEPLEQANAISEAADIVYADSNGGNLICLSTCTGHVYRTVVVFEYVDNQKPISGSLKQKESLESTQNRVNESSSVTPEAVSTDIEDIATDSNAESGYENISEAAGGGDISSDGESTTVDEGGNLTSG